MKKNKTVVEVNEVLMQLEADVQKITAILVDLVKDDQAWWESNLCLLASQPLDSLKKNLKVLADDSLSPWQFVAPEEAQYSSLDPLEALVWLAGLCRLDRVLIGALPRRFVEDFDLQWKVLALHWVA